MTTKKWQARNKNDLIIEVWESLDCESVGTAELQEIQRALQERFGEGAQESPAAIARTVADEGAVLRHPEVFQCDLKWRKQNLETTSFRSELDFSSISTALESLARVEAKRREFEAENSETGRETLRSIVSNVRQDCLLVARGKIVDRNQREEAKEIAEWLRVWLQSPKLFNDWLELRLRSPEFLKKFSGDHSVTKEEK